MGKIALAWDDKLSYTGPVITASSARPDSPALRVATAQPSDAWRTVEGVNSAALFADLVVARTVNSVFIGNANLTPTATWRIRLSTTDPTGVANTVIDTGTVTMGINTTERCMFKIVGPASGRYLRVDITDTAVTSLEVGILSPYAALWRPPYNFQTGLKRPFADFSVRRSGPDGQQRARRGSIQPGIIFTLPAISLTELRTLAVPMVRYGGLAQEVCVCLDPDDAVDVGFQTFRGFMEETPAFDQFMTKYGRAPYQVMRRI